MKELTIVQVRQNLETLVSILVSQMAFSSEEARAKAERAIISGYLGIDVGADDEMIDQAVARWVELENLRRNNSLAWRSTEDRVKTDKGAGRALVVGERRNIRSGDDKPGTKPAGGVQMLYGDRRKR